MLKRADLHRKEKAEPKDKTLPFTKEVKMKGD